LIETTYEYQLLEDAKNGNKESQNEFLEQNKGLVHLVVKRFLNRGTDTDDLIQLGMMGLYKAMKNFDFSYDVKFSTYAVPVISGEIKRFLRDDGIIKISRSTKELAAKIRKKSEEFEKKYLREPTVSEISKLVSASREDVILAINSTDMIASLDDSASKEDEKLLLLDKLSDDKNENEEKIIDKLTLKEMLLELKVRERQVIVFRYFKEMTQENIAKILGISQVQVSRIEKKVLEILKSKLEN